MTSIEMKGAEMSELYKAMKRIEDYQSTKPLYKQIAEIKGIASTARYGYDIQPQLTILKSIAVLLDERWIAQSRYLQRKVTVPWDALYNAVNPYDNELAGTRMGEWIDENQNICFAYLAGKALGVYLVKVVEGEIWN